MTTRKPTTTRHDTILPDAMIESLVNGIQPAELGAEQRDRMRKRVVQLARETAPEGTATQRNAAAQWRQIAPFVEVRELSRDEQSGTHVSLMRMQPGGVIKPHRHSKAEDFIVLEGECRIGAHVLSAGDVHHAAAGSLHDLLTTQTGVLVLVRGEFPYPKIHV